MSIETAFLFDAVACSGCKACVIACKDKHSLPVGQNWRRVYDVSGGDWLNRDDAWLAAGVSGYALSVACNHCAQPICLEVCPANAIEKRGDGLVLLKQDQCIGCGYCAWACPYGALQYNPAAGVMGKCTFCVDLLDQGLPPACVAACPMRALDFKSGAQIALHGGYAPKTSHHAPLPEPSLTAPALFIRQHTQAQNLGAGAPLVYGPFQHEKAHSPLVAFTLLGQFAVGSFLAWLGFSNLVGGTFGGDLLLGLALLALLAGMLISTLHLGKPGRFLGALRNVRQSWLSREVWLAGLFTAGVLLVGSIEWAGVALGSLVVLLQLGTAFAGLGLVFAMSRLYMLRTVPTWAPATTLVSFSTTTLLLGSLAVGIVLQDTPHWGWRILLGSIAVAHWWAAREWMYTVRKHKLRLSGSKVPPAWFTSGRHLGFPREPLASMSSSQISKAINQVVRYRQAAVLLVGLLIIFWPPSFGLFLTACFCFVGVEAWGRIWFYRGYFRVGI